MVAPVLRLKLISIANRVARPGSVAERWALAFGVLGIIAVAALFVVFVRSVVGTTPELRQDGFIVVGTVLVAMFWFMPFAFRLDDDLDPRAFTPFAIDARRLALGLALSGFLCVPVLLLVAVVAALVATSAADGPAAVATAIASGLGIIVSSVLASLVASRLARRGFVARNIGGLAVLLATAVAAPLVAILAFIDWPALGTTYLRRAAAVLEWTPWGAPWAAPGAAGRGDVLDAVAGAGIGIALAVIFWFAWSGLVSRAVRTRERLVAPRRRQGLGVFDVMPATQTGVIGARSITYWMRDPRYLVPVLMLPIVPLVIIVAFTIAGIPSTFTMWLPVPMLALLIGWGVHNDIAADGTAFYSHVVTSASGRADRWGRIFAPLILGVVVAFVGAWLTGVVTGDDSVIVPIAALSLCALLTALGVGSMASAILPYPTVAPGDSPFQQPQGTSGGDALKQAMSFVATVVLLVPIAVLFGVAIALVPPLVPFMIAAALAFGLVVLVVGIEIGAAVVNRRAPELFAFTLQN